MRARSTILACALVTAAIAARYGSPLVLAGADRTAHLPGHTSPGHRLFEEACDTCHTPFRAVSNDACLRCHGAGLTTSEDTHPESKFVDPRNADRVAGLDARACVTCHREHAPARTRAIGVTQPGDFCRACHADIGRERPSHAAMPLDGCARAGCHRFHDNRGLHEAYLAAHLGEAENRIPPDIVRLTAATAAGTALTASQADVPASARAVDSARFDAATREWAGTSHARGGVNCTHCHVVRDGESGAPGWKDRPGDASCGGCHGSALTGFLRGQHGVRAALGIPPLRPSMARLAMKAESRDRTLGCESCHGAHAYDTAKGAVEACLACHDDAHSRGYLASRHAVAWRREQTGAAPAGSGVSCATCHMPRTSRKRRGIAEVRASHDVSAELRPRDKMIRSACSRCHGLGFVLDAVADPDLAARGFNGRPSAHVESLDMIERRRAAGGRR